ncbi:MAG: hypothetical protein U1E73_10330 [Planctomycetota bacterium]
MTASRLPLLIAGIAALTASLSAQTFDSTIYNRGIRGTVGLIAGTTSNLTTVGGAYGPAAPATEFVTTSAGAAWTPALPPGSTTTTNPDTWQQLANGTIVSGDPLGVVRQWNVASGAPTQLGAPMPAYIRTIGEHAGNLVVGGAFTPLGGIASLLSWNAAAGQWQPYGSVGGVNVTGTVFGALPYRGDMICYGPTFQAPGIGSTMLARFNGAAWTAIPTIPTTSTQPLEFAAVLANGDIVAMHRTPGLGTTPPYDLYRLSNGVWKHIAKQIDAPVRALLELPDGDLLIGGQFTTVNFTGATGLARYDGNSWSAVANVQGSVFALHMFADDVLGVGGNFTAVNGITAIGIAGFRPSVPGMVSPVGAGCVGLGGLNTLAPINQPLLGRTFSSLATGLGNPAMVVMARSSARLPSPVSLSTIFSTGLPNCFVYGTSELLDVILAPGPGTTTLSFAIPADPLFLGYQLWQQATYFETTEVTATNAQSVVSGKF